MSEQLLKLSVRMLGKEEITYGNRQIISGRNCVSKAIKLFLILLHSGEEGISRSGLLEALYGREDIVDASNNLRVTAHRLKKMLSESGFPEYDYIVSKNGIYKWQSPMQTEVDALVFRELMQKASAEEDEEKKAELVSEGLKLYQGDFLPKLSGDEWVLMESVQYKKLYTQALEWMCSYLKERKEFEEILSYIEPACRIYPLDEWQSVKIDCYIELNRYEEALEEYEKTARLLFEELGVSPYEKMIEQFSAMSEHISGRPQFIEEIKGGLREEGQERGAFYCSAPSFRDAYRMTRRNMERNGQSVYLMLCTITDGKGHCMTESEKLEDMSEVLCESIQRCLRRCDSFTRYNSAQFLIMLTGINEENCNIVMSRITDEFSKEHKTWSKRLECCVSSLYDME